MKQYKPAEEKFKVCLNAMAVIVYNFSSAISEKARSVKRTGTKKNILLLSEMISKGLNENRSFRFRGFVSFPLISDFRPKMTSQKFFEMEELTPDQGSGCSTAVEHTPHDRVRIPPGAGL